MSSDRAESAFEWIARHYVVLMAVFSALFLALNYGDQSMQGIVPAYRRYSLVFQNGIHSPAGRLPTFPMWGYGWLIFLLKSKLAILILQQILAMVAVVTAVSVCERDETLPHDSATLLKIVLVFSIPWYALHSVFWPYSIATSLLVISISLLARFAVKGSTDRMILVISAICFGLLLHFRSDFILFPPVCAAALSVFRSRSSSRFLSALVWVALVYLLLLPWTLYTRRATGHLLLTSTNSGQVLFLGLGVLPDNKWGITPDDSDPLMKKLVTEKLGPGANPLSYDGNGLLLHETFERIKADPLEFTRKIGYSAVITVVRGFHPGSFFDRKTCEPRCYDAYVRQRNDLLHFRAPTQPELLNPLRTLAEMIASVVSRLLLIACVIALPVALYLAVTRVSVLLLLSVLTALYQGAISVFSFTLPGYTSNAYFFHILNLVTVAAWLRMRQGRQYKIDPGPSRS